MKLFPISVALIVSGGIFVGSLIFALIRRRYLKAFLLGTITFIVSQLLLRLPFLQWLHQISPSLRIFFAAHPLVNGFFLAVTAGIFEETGRFLAFHGLQKTQRIPKQALVFGLGHGGAEALLLVFPSILLNLQNPQLSNQSLYLTSFERISAISLHVLLSLIVCYAVRIEKKRFWFLAITLHTIGNLLVVIVPFFGGGILATEGIFALYVLILFLVWKIYLKHAQKYPDWQNLLGK